ncbi:MAG: replicative DNA helicase, partial [Solirubrobacterales bacterium]
MSANGQLPEPEPSMATAQKTHVPPQNLEAEESVLGAMMVASAAIDPVMVEVRLRVEDFYREQHRQIFAAIQRLEVGGDPVDALTVSEALSQAGELEAAGGRDAISSLAATAPAPGNARHYAEIVQQNALLRRLIGAAQTIQQSVSERHDEPKQLAERAEALLFKVAHEEQASDFRTIGEVLDDELEKLEKL